MRNVMVDLETISTKPNAAIVAIGACEFNVENGTWGRTFYTNVDWKSNLSYNRHVDLDTIQWWMKQSDEARMALVNGSSKSFAAALLDFGLFYKECGAKAIWSHANFDERILETAYADIDTKKPWHFKDIRDIRTTMSMLPKDVHDQIWEESKRVGTHHNALDDAIFQVGYVSKAVQWLRYLNGKV